MMKLSRRLCRGFYWIVVLALLAAPGARAEAFSAPECRPLVEGDADFSTPEIFARGLLWEVSRDGIPASHIFGTIHISDAEVTTLPAPVTRALDASRRFVMEVLPGPQDMQLVSTLMFFTDNSSLDSLLSEPLFNRTVDLLRPHQLNTQVISAMKPWAAYMTMSYPPQTGAILDLQLLQRARAAGMALTGLETLDEQLNIFNDLAMENQIDLLIDTICHYDLVVEGFDEMKRLYIKRDLKGLFIYSQKYAVPGDDIYDELMDRLMRQRNYKMVERMQPPLRQGQAFIAIGAMHLPGHEGVLNLLKQKGYTIKLVY